MPDDGDAYILAQILHDWPDAEAGAILAACVRAMRPDARLWVIERVIPPVDDPPLGYALLDLSMLVHFGGRERKLDEFADLLTGAGLQDPVPLESTSGWTVLESARR
ncbi:MAG TPA: methyltransferase [Nocardioidaceae bacterium]|nr:methyltransferase [Nocardioidaceae bacterium]